MSFVYLRQGRPCKRRRINQILPEYKLGPTPDAHATDGEGGRLIEMP
jgi:hypothetical protein